jgi:hypothetical protein
MGVPPSLVELVFKWAEWKSVKATARSLDLAGAMSRIASTAPKGASINEELNQCILALDQDLGICIAILVSHWREPWPKSKRWREFLKLVRLKRGGIRMALEPGLKEPGQAGQGQGGIVSSQADILSSWQQVADYLGVSIKTAKRWDKADPMPIKRPRRGVVITSRAALQKWIDTPTGAFNQYQKTAHKIEGA